jgi:hypothetical protein
MTQTNDKEPEFTRVMTDLEGQKVTGVYKDDHSYYVQTSTGQEFVFAVDLNIRVRGPSVCLVDHGKNFSKKFKDTMGFDWKMWYNTYEEKVAIAQEGKVKQALACLHALADIPFSSATWTPMVNAAIKYLNQCTLPICSFCHKTQDQVKKLISAPGVLICDECVSLCDEILVDDGIRKKEGTDGST